jgi:nitrogen regulatory protein P-II 2
MFEPAPIVLEKSSMRMLVALIQPTKLKAVQEALAKIGVERMTVCDAQGYGRQRGQSASYRGIEYKVNLLRKVALEIAVNEDFVDKTIDTIQQVARFGADGNIGDGKIFVLPVEEVVRLSDGVRGPEGVS